jgi:hypothetical protein
MMDHQLMCGAISCGAITLFQEATDYTGPERREHKRYPRSLGIAVQPMDPRQSNLEQEFLAMTREVSRSGLSFVSSQRVASELVAISLQDDPTRVVICRVCELNEFQGDPGDDVYLTSVEFLYERQA